MAEYIGGGIWRDNNGKLVFTNPNDPSLASAGNNAATGTGQPPVGTSGDRYVGNGMMERPDGSRYFSTGGGDSAGQNTTTGGGSGQNQNLGNVMQGRTDLPATSGKDQWGNDIINGGRHVTVNGRRLERAYDWFGNEIDPSLNRRQTGSDGFTSFYDNAGNMVGSGFSDVGLGGDFWNERRNYYQQNDPNFAVSNWAKMYGTNNPDQTSKWVTPGSNSWNTSRDQSWQNTGTLAGAGFQTANPGVQRPDDGGLGGVGSRIASNQYQNYGGNKGNGGSEWGDLNRTAF